MRTTVLVWPFGEDIFDLEVLADVGELKWLLALRFYDVVKLMVTCATPHLDPSQGPLRESISLAKFPTKLRYDCSFGDFVNVI